MKQILCCGYIALDLVSYKGRLVRRAAGGTAGNVAANLAFLGWRSRVAGLIGVDAAGRTLQGDLRRSGVNTDDLALRADVGTPLVLHDVQDGGHRFWFHCPECGRRFPKYRPMDEVQARELAARVHPDVFFFDRASLATAVLAETLREKGTIIVFEPSTLGREPDRCARAADIVKYSSERAPAVQHLLGAATPRLQIVTDGARGASARIDGKEIHVPGFRAQVVDAGGAGDWTTAGFLWGWLRSAQPSWSAESVRGALRGAQAMAAVSCGYPGARTLSEHLTREQLLGAVGKLLEEQAPTTAEVRTLRRPRPRANGCQACLAAAS